MCATLLVLPSELVIAAIVPDVVGCRRTDAYCVRLAGTGCWNSDYNTYISINIMTWTVSLSLSLIASLSCIEKRIRKERERKKTYLVVSKEMLLLLQNQGSRISPQWKAAASFMEWKRVAEKKELEKNKGEGRKREGDTVVVKSLVFLAFQYPRSNLVRLHTPESRIRWLEPLKLSSLSHVGHTLSSHFPDTLPKIVREIDSRVL